jgi:hypothetical protein
MDQLAMVLARGSRGDSKYYNGIVMNVTEFEATVRKVGDSMGIIIPGRIVSEIKARPGQKIRIVIPGKVDWSKLWGRLHSELSTEEMIRRARTERD